MSGARGREKGEAVRSRSGSVSGPGGFVVRHESGAFYSFRGRDPHVTRADAVVLPDLDRARQIAALLTESAGRGSYAAEPWSAGILS